MLNTDMLRKKDHSNYIKSIGVARQLVTGNPHLCGTDELPFLTPAYAGQRASEFQRFACLHLYECHHPLPPVSRSASRHQVDIAVAATEPLLRYLPPVGVKPPGGDALAANTHLLPSSGHGGKVLGAAGVQASFLCGRNQDRVKLLHLGHVKRGASAHHLKRRNNRRGSSECSR